MNPLIVDRPYSLDTQTRLVAAGVHPVLARIYAARGVESASQIDTALDQLLPPAAMHNLAHMAVLLADAIAAGKRLLIVADYDADGATACAIGLLGLRTLGALVSYLVPNRFEFGYGLTPEIVRLAARTSADILITVDNGIASMDGVDEANRLGMQVLITDHHLPAEQLPAAACIVNPNQPGCGFASKHLAGVGVMFYVLLQLRAELRARGRFAAGTQPNLAALLDLVALGTVADVVRLDDNNRLLVQQGLARIRTGKCRPGILALFEVAGRDPARASAYDLGFVLGPRLNAAGRLEDMALGIECLTTDEPDVALVMARRLDELNRERRTIEAQMQDGALAQMETIEPGDAWGLALFDPAWHQGVIGILAARLRERYHRPVIAFAAGTQGELKGSGRSIPGLHLRDALDLISKRAPRLLLRFGGHAAAAGLSIRADDFASFARIFDHTLRELLRPADLQRCIETDGTLNASETIFSVAELLSGPVWGQGFPQPRFRGEFRVEEQRALAGSHLRLRLRSLNGTAREPVLNAVLFGDAGPLPEQLLAVYRLDVNEFNGNRMLQLVIEHWESLQPGVTATGEN